MQALVWYDKAGSDERPWLVRQTDGRFVRARIVTLQGLVRTDFNPEGFSGLPCGPKGVVVCDDVFCQDAEGV